MSSIDNLPQSGGPPWPTTKLNRYFTKALFWDVAVQLREEDREDFKPPFTLYKMKPGYICFRTTFVELQDPTGYDWAMQYLGDYGHWKELLKCKWFQEALQTAQEELSQKLKAQALKVVLEIASNGSPASLPAAKYIAERGWEKRAGRPSKVEIDKELKKATEVLDAETEDLVRIGGLKLISGGKK